MTTWKGNELRTHRDVFDAFTTTESDEEARAFLRAAGPEAASNIQYMIGYCDREAAVRLWDKLDRTRPREEPR